MDMNSKEIKQDGMSNDIIKFNILLNSLERSAVSFQATDKKAQWVLLANVVYIFFLIDFFLRLEIEIQRLITTGLDVPFLPILSESSFILMHLGVLLTLISCVYSVLAIVPRKTLDVFEEEDGFSSEGLCRILRHNRGVHNQKSILIRKAIPYTVSAYLVLIVLSQVVLSF